MISEREVEAMIPGTLDFLRFCEKSLNLSELLTKVKYLPPSRGGPRRPRFKAGNIVMWTVLAAHIAAGSFKKAESLLASIGAEGRNGALFVLKHLNVLPCCDATIELRLNQIELASLSSFARSIAMNIARMCSFKSPRPPVGKVIAILDGSYFFAGMWGSAMIIPGEIDFMIDFEPYASIGKESSAVQRLLERNKQFLKEHVDILSLDGLYWKEKILKFALELGLDLTVRVSERDDKEGKIRQDYRRIITEMKEAIEYKRKTGRNPKGKSVKQVDYDHECAGSYLRAKVIRVSGLTYAGVQVYMYDVRGKWIQGRKRTNGESFIMSTLGDIGQAIGSAIARSRVEESFDRIKNTYKINEDFVYKGDEKKYTKKEVSRAFRQFHRLMLCAFTAINMSSFYIWISTSKKERAERIRKALVKQIIHITLPKISSKKLLDQLHEEAVVIKHLAIAGNGKVVARLISKATGAATFPAPDTS